VPEAPRQYWRLWRHAAQQYVGIIHRVSAIMLSRIAADGVLLLHMAFIAFALLGAAIAVWWRWIPLVHLPAAVWALYIELTGRICPLTYLENYLRIRADQTGYTESFIEHYLLGIVYPSGLTREIQFALVLIVVVTNVAIYGWLFYRQRASRGRDA
jgi:Protein of Unknown function (DUF2784)